MHKHESIGCEEEIPNAKHSIDNLKTTKANQTMPCQLMLNDKEKKTIRKLRFHLPYSALAMPAILIAANLVFLCSC